MDTTVNLPASTDGQSVQVRWRMGTDGSVSAVGWRVDTIRLSGAADFGDATLPYPVTLSENGARHLAVGPTLGATRDAEADGTHSANATSDGADDDGVTLGTIQVGALGATATVNVASAPSGAKLDAWIDFNGDGSWGGAGEQIAASIAVVNGVNTITFDVPSAAKDGTTFARFRLSTAGNLGLEGSAADGEVEDYAVTITPPAAASGVFGGQNTVTTGADGAFNVFAADVDGDGDMDVLSASFNDDTYRFSTPSGSEVDIIREFAGQGTDLVNFSAITVGVTFSLNTSSVQPIHAGRTLQLNSNITFENAIGGSANDTLIGNTLSNRLTGGNGHNILVGLDGSDILESGTGRDILIGGLGLDTLNGGANEDILIAGRTTSDTNVANLNTLRTEWISVNSYATRITNLRAGVGSPVVSLKRTINVLNDAGEDDSLTGGIGIDWYFRALDDVITDLFAGETIDLL